tara:strand:+ start:328 stop:528 length:201 start_codon:yes stop_codon:yes gene_type:complete
MDFVNIVNYKMSMENKNKYKNQENKALNQDTCNPSGENSTGIYLRDDHCDWGSSGMNEFTNEYNSN